MKILFAIGIALALAGCASAPETFVVAPNVQVSSSQTGNQGRFALNCVDLRSANYLVQIERDDQAAQLRRASANLRQLVCAELSYAWQSQGFIIDPLAETQVDVAINEMRVVVEQKNLGYEADSLIQMRVDIRDGARQLGRPYTGKASSEGALGVDQASLEQDFNLLLGKVLTDIANDQTLQGALQ